VTYPETVDLARVLVMPGWRRPTGRTTKQDLRRFRRDINDHVGIRYRPQDNSRDPLLRWFQKRHPPRKPMNSTGDDQL
jgi:hypothetical protein